MDLRISGRVFRLLKIEYFLLTVGKNWPFDVISEALGGVNRYLVTVTVYSGQSLRKAIAAPLSPVPTR